MSDRAHMRSGTSRRDLLKKAGIGAGVLVWSQPVIQAVTASPAAAFTPFCNPEITAISLDIVFEVDKNYLVTVSGTGNCGACPAGTFTYDLSMTTDEDNKANLSPVDANTWRFTRGNCGNDKNYTFTASVTVTCLDTQQYTCTQSFDYESDGANCAGNSWIETPGTLTCP